MSDTARVSVPVWDLPTRLFHWLIVLLVITSIVTGKVESILGPGTLEWHKRAGYAILALLAFRLAWGFVGGTHARFTNFVRAPSTVLAYAKGMAGRGPVAEPIGHNPLGGWSVIAMLMALATQAVTGLFLIQEDYAFEGPLAKHVSHAVSDRLGAIHEANFWLIALLVALHVAAIVFYATVKRQDLVGAMLSGRKSLVRGREGEGSRGGNVLAGAVVVAASAAAVWALVTFA